jgi:hypothetical protein
VEFSTSFATFLMLTLKTIEDVVEGEMTLARWPHAAAHNEKPTRLHRRKLLVSNSYSMAVKVEDIAGARGGYVLVVA